MTDYMKANTVSDILRSILTTLLERPAFLLLNFVYQVFFNVTTMEMISADTMLKIFRNLQLIIGIFMLFKFAVTILEGIVDPNRVTDKKNGANKIISRIIVSLVLLALITPINIPNPNNSWEKQLKNNGIIFGALYSLQDRILSNNTIGRIILNDTSTQNDLNTATTTKAEQFSKQILSGFLRINIREDAESPVDETDEKNWACNDTKSKQIIEKFQKQTTQGMISLVNEDCGGGKYIFAYSPIGGICAYIIVVILILYTIDVAIRAIKLAILRLIAPIPIISHMSISKKESKGADSFSTWISTMTTTYLELFIRLAILHFVIFLIQNMITEGIVLDTGTGITGALAFVFIVIGFFLFARQAPRFIQSALGMQSSAGGIGLTMAAAGLGTYLGGGDAKDMYENMMTASRTTQNGGKDLGKNALFTHRDNQIKGAQAKYREALEEETWKRQLDMDGQDEKGFIKPKRALIPILGSKKLVKAQRAQYALDQNQKRYQANWQTHERSTGRGITTRGGSEFHTRTDAYPQPTTAGTFGTPPSGPAIDVERQEQVYEALHDPNANFSDDQRKALQAEYANAHNGLGYDGTHDATGRDTGAGYKWRREELNSQQPQQGTPPGLPPAGGTTGSNNDQGQQ